jgi:hypothetical protein
MKHAKSIMVFIMIAALLGAVGCSDQGPAGGQGQKPMANRTPNIPSGDEAPEDPVISEVTGVLEQGEAGVMLVADSGTYLVTGQDLTEMVGKTVMIKGAVEESAGQKKITVDIVNVVE